MRYLRQCITFCAEEGEHRMRIPFSTLAALLGLLLGSEQGVFGQVSAPPGGLPPQPGAARPQPGQPGQAARGEAPPGAPGAADVDELLKDYDINQDGYLTRQELPPSLRQRFDQIDTDKDGKISRRELERGLMHLHPQHRPSDFIFALVELSTVDPHNQGEVQRIYDVLRKLDRNRDGKIDAEELKVGQQQIVQDRIKFLFDELDADKDGRISKTEARGQLRQDFNQLDANRDGFIDRDELRRAAAVRPPADSQPQPGAERVPPPADRGTAPRTGAQPLPEPPPAPATVPGCPPLRRVPPSAPVPPPPA
jgi:Ca2+-binding EF-hand superfamily protein